MLHEIELRHVVLNKMIWVYAKDVYSGLGIDEGTILKMIDAEDLKEYNGTNLISEWALLAIDVQMKTEGIERRFVLI